MAPPILKMATKMGGLWEEAGKQNGENMNDNKEENKYHTYHAMGKVTNNEIN